MATYLTCPMCGFEFDKTDTLCAHGCPLGALCTLIRCPGCGYEFPETPKVVSWVGRLFRRRSAAEAPLPEGIRLLSEAKRGERVEVMCLGSTTSPRHQRLAVFGMVPGARITVIQQRPACVVKVDETELALDPEIARDILVHPGAEAA
jgi:Fe2+ transport system protein FeoA/rubredoxin